MSLSFHLHLHCVLRCHFREISAADIRGMKWPIFSMLVSSTNGVDLHQDRCGQSQKQYKVHSPGF